MKAPKRRIDNVITRLTDSVHLLQVHTTVSCVCRSHLRFDAVINMDESCDRSVVCFETCGGLKVA